MAPQPVSLTLSLPESWRCGQGSVASFSGRVEGLLKVTHQYSPWGVISEVWCV